MANDGATMAHCCHEKNRWNAGTIVPLTVLNVAYPLAPVSQATAGGAEQVLLTLDEGLVRVGHRSLVVAAAGSRVRGLLLPVQSPSVNLTEGCKHEARESFRNALNIAVQRFRVDVIHMHGIDFGEYLPAFDLPVVVSLHLPLNWYPRKHLQHPAENVSLVCVSRSQAQSRPPGMQLTQVIPNGVDLWQFRPTARKNDYVLFMGRICPEKGLHIALHAAKRAQQKLLIAGTLFDYPDHRKYFERDVQPHLGANAALLGAVGGRRKASLLAGAKCLLIPSQALETSSLIAMEAMASGTPVIAWRTGALPDIVVDQKTGFLVESVSEMSDAIRHAGKLSATACRREAEVRFSADGMLGAYLALYKDLARGIRMPELQAA
jgi:glycosyltransferase involved in cell wall biosynthesis